MGVGLNLRLAFHLTSGRHGTIATFDSVDQGAYGAAVSSIRRSGDHVTLEMSAINAVLDTDLSNHGEMMSGVFTQNGFKIPLTLTRLAHGAPSPWPAPAPALTLSARPTQWTIPSDAEIAKLLTQRIDVEHQGVGIVVGLIDSNGRRIIALRPPRCERPSSAHR